MTGPRIDIRSATSAEHEHAVACVVAAFITDPVARFAWPRPHDYLRCMPVGIRALATESIEGQGAQLSADRCGAALWLPPGAHADGEALEQHLRATAEPAHLDDLLGTFEQIEKANPDEPHWHLAMIGVEPHAQGRGLGDALLRHALARCDRERALAYLESSNPRNITLYERHGFERVGEIRVGAAPVVTPMLRRPR